ncbi:ankyrin repeat-containing domain protein [Neocallimastix sp. 'constans']
MTYIIYLHKQPNIVILNIKSLNGLSVTLKGFLKQHAENLSSSQSKELTKLFKGIKENQILKKYVILLREMQIFIIENGENINRKDINGYSLLMMASQNNHIKIVKYLSLIIACANGHDEIVKLLLNVVKLLVSNLANVNIKNSNGYFDIMKYLIEHGVDINNIINNNNNDNDNDNDCSNHDKIEFMINYKADIRRRMSQINNNRWTDTSLAINLKYDVKPYRESLTMSCQENVKPSEFSRELSVVHKTQLPKLCIGWCKAC